MNFVLQALSWADSHGLLTPAILAALTLLVRALWAAVRPALAARWPRATEAAEAVGERVAAVLPDVLRALVPPRPQPSRETAPPGRSGEAGRVTVAALVTVTLLWLLVAALAACPPPVGDAQESAPAPDLADVRGQLAARRALQERPGGHARAEFPGRPQLHREQPGAGRRQSVQVVQRLRVMGRGQSG